MKRFYDAITDLRIKNLKGLTQEEMDRCLCDLDDLVFKIMDEQKVKSEGVRRSEQLNAFFEFLEFRGYLNCDPTKANQIIKDHIDSL